MCSVFRNFFREKPPKFDIHFKRSIFGRINLKHIENEKALGGSGGVLLRKIFENLLTVVANFSTS